MHTQFKWIIKQLNSAGVRYWVDSGTLLGLVRNEKILEHDTDLDISCYVAEAPKIRSLVPKFRNQGYVFKNEVFQDTPTKYYFSPPDPSQDYGLDIQFYQKTGPWAWKATRSFSPPRIQNNVGLVYLLKCWFINLLPSVRKKLIHEKIKLHPYKWPLCKMYKIGAWIFESNYFDFLDQIEVENLSIPVPDGYEDYLEFRYGDWQQEDKDWDYWQQDRGHNHIHPTQVAEWKPRDFKNLPIKKDTKSFPDFSLDKKGKRWLIVKTSGLTLEKLLPQLQDNSQFTTIDILHMSEPGQETEPPLPDSENITFPGERFTPSQLTGVFLKKLNDRNYDGALLLYNNLMDSTYRPAEKALTKIPAAKKFGLDSTGHLIEYDSVQFKSLLTTRKFINLFRPFLAKMLVYYLKIKA